MARRVEYSYKESLKSDASDELINTYILRPVAGLLVRALYRTRVTPNQVTLAATASGLAAAALYWQGTPLLTALAGICLTGKDLLDSADGQLARAKGLFSRAGRFLDSIGDFAVNLAVFPAIAVAMVRRRRSPPLPVRVPRRFPPRFVPRILPNIVPPSPELLCGKPDVRGDP